MKLEERVKNLEEVVAQLYAEVQRLRRVAELLQDLDMEKVGELYQMVRLKKHET
jgi:galactokinase